MRSIVFLVLLLGLAGCSVPVQRSLTSAAGQGAAADPAAQAGMLTFIPDRPTPGQRVEAAYRPSNSLTGEPRLHLRARLRTPEHDSYNNGVGSRTVAILERQRDGTYRGGFSLAGEVVYAAFAVEDPAATRTDSREGRFWELFVHGSDGRPLFEAVAQRFNDHMGRDQLAVLETAQAMVRLYPERPAGWNTLRAAEGWVLGDEGAEDRLARHRERLRAFDRALAEQQNPIADQVGYLYWYARALGEEEIGKRWRARLMAEHPGHFFAVQERVIEQRLEHREDPAALLRELEALWGTAEDRQARERIVGPASAAARQIGDSATILRWAHRRTDLDPSVRSSVATTLAGIAATREEGIRRLRTEISTVEQVPDEERPLGATAAEHRENATRRAAALRASLGRSLLAGGLAQEGTAVLEQAARVGWSTSRFRSLGDSRFSAGDREGTIHAFAAVAADPSTSAETADSLRAVAGADALGWEEAVSHARTEMLQRTLQSARAEPLPPVQMAARNGTLIQLEELLGEEATVVVFWSRYCGYSVEAMPRIAALAERIAEEGVPLLAVTGDSPAEAEPYLQESGWDIQVLYDTEGEAVRALNSWGTPQYFVLDGVGRLRFAFSSLDDLPRQTAALQAQGDVPLVISGTVRP